MTTRTVPNVIAGLDAGTATPLALLDVFNPATGAVIAKVPMSGAGEVDLAVREARAAFPAWAATPIKERVQVFYRYKALLEQHIDELTALVTEENGKIASEARAEVLKSAELTEFACSLPQIVTGEVLEVSRGVECRVERFPLGVVAAIAPFNFPNMVPHWSIPNALALGNTMILKPSELVPLSATRIAELLREAGLPDGVLQVVNGGQEAVEAVCDHPGIAAVSFVGSTRVAQIVYRRATSHLKRCLALGGAKNHLIVMPDADLEMASSNIVASMSGCAGQRCMAASVMLAVQDVDHIIARQHGGKTEAENLEADCACPEDVARGAHDRREPSVLHLLSRRAVGARDGIRVPGAQWGHASSRRSSIHRGGCGTSMSCGPSLSSMMPLWRPSNSGSTSRPC